MIFQYTFIPKPCHPSRHAKPFSSHRLQRQANLQSTHTHRRHQGPKALRHPSIMRQILSPIHIQFKCSPLSWHPCLKRQPHIHSAHIAQPSHLMSHSSSTQPQSCHNHKKGLSSNHAIHTMPCVLMHNLTSTHAFTALQGSKEIFHTHTSCH